MNVLDWFSFASFSSLLLPYLNFDFQPGTRFDLMMHFMYNTLFCIYAYLYQVH